MSRPPLTARVAFAAAPALAAAVGGVGARKAPQVYGRLRKPRWAPPPAAFGPVWTVLYVLLGVAGWRLAGRPVPRKVLVLHGAQLALNGLWPVVFFAGRRRTASLAVIGALDATVTAEAVLVARCDPATAGLLAPYLAWCGFATALNASVGDPASSRAGE
jgi:tryptophan-rich sensory protein